MTPSNSRDEFPGHCHFKKCSKVDVILKGFIRAACRNQQKVAKRTFGFGHNAELCGNLGAATQWIDDYRKHDCFKRLQARNLGLFFALLQEVQKFAHRDDPNACRNDRIVIPPNSAGFQAIQSNLPSVYDIEFSQT